MAIPTMIQHVTGPCTNTGVSTYKLQLTHPSLSGNCIVVAITTNNTNPTITVADDKSNTYTAGPSISGNQQVALFFALNATAGVTVITFSLSVATQFVQAIATEFNNIATSAASDGNSTGTGTSATVATGSITTTVAGDLIYHVGWSDSGVQDTSWTAGTSPFKLIAADISNAIIGGLGVQFQIQASAGAITPSMTHAPSTNHFDTVAIALKSASSGTALPAGMRVLNTYHATIPGTATSPLSLQFPCSGNLVVAATLFIPALAVTAIGSTPSNTWAFTGANFSVSGAGSLRIGYAANATTSSAMIVSVTFTGTNSSGDTIVFFDVTGAATAPFDSTAGNQTASGTDTTTTAHNISTVSITPSTADGIIFSMMGVANPGPVDGVSPGAFIACVSSPEGSSGDMDENNGWGAEFNSTTSLRTYLYHFPATAGGAGNWAAIAAHFEAPQAVAGGYQGMPVFWQG